MKLYHLTCNDTVIDVKGEHHYSDKRVFYTKKLLVGFLLRHHAKFNPGLEEKDLEERYYVIKIDMDKCPLYEKIFPEYERRLVYTKEI